MLTKEHIDIIKKKSMETGITEVQLLDMMMKFLGMMPREDIALFVSSFMDGPKCCSTNEAKDTEGCCGSREVTGMCCGARDRDKK